MLTRSIRFKNFSGKKNKLLNKKLINIFKSENWLTKYPLLNSLNKNYNYSYKNKNISWDGGMPPPHSLCKVPF